MKKVLETFFKSIFAALVFLIILFTSYSAFGNSTQSWKVFEKEGKFGYKDSDGNIVITAQFYKAKEFSEDWAAVRPDMQTGWGYIDISFLSTGKFIVEPHFFEARSFHKNVAVVRIESPGEVDTGNEEDADKEWSSFVRNIIKGKFGYIEKSFAQTKKFFIEPQFDWAMNFSEGLAGVCKGKIWGFIDVSFSQTGKYFIKPHFSAVMSFSEGLAAVADRLGNWGYIDKSYAQTEEYAIEPEYFTAGIFKKGLAEVVTHEGETVVIDKTGIEVR